MQMMNRLNDWLKMKRKRDFEEDEEYEPTAPNDDEFLSDNGIEDSPPPSPKAQGVKVEDDMIPAKRPKPTIDKKTSKVNKKQQKKAFQGQIRVVSLWVCIGTAKRSGGLQKEKWTELNYMGTKKRNASNKSFCCFLRGTFQSEMEAAR